MATTFSPSDALEYAMRFEGNTPIDDVDLELRILQAASDMIHLASPWRWTVALTTSQSIVAGTVDYTVSAPNPAALYLVRAQIRAADGTVKEIKPSSNLSNDGNIKGVPEEIELTSQTNVRIFPVPTAGIATRTLIVHHKKANTIITQGNKGTASTLLIPDEWFWVYQEAVLLWAMKFAQNPAAGAVTFAQGQAQYTGQHGFVMSLLAFMMQKEKPFYLDTQGVVNG